MPAKFFITHSWKDIDFARRLHAALSARGLVGFFDASSLTPGDMISAEIQRGLEACDVYIPILSHAALKSPWCEEEINAAITLGKSPGRNGRPRIIPVLIEDCQNELPIFLRSRLYINFTGRYEAGLDELLTKGFGVGQIAGTIATQPQRPSISFAPLPRQRMMLLLGAVLLLILMAVLVYSIMTNQVLMPLQIGGASPTIQAHATNTIVASVVPSITPLQFRNPSCIPPVPRNQVLPTPVTSKLNPFVDVSGYLQYADGAAIPNAKIESDKGDTVTTDNQGYFTTRVHARPGVRFSATTAADTFTFVVDAYGDLRIILCIPR